MMMRGVHRNFSGNTELRASRGAQKPSSIINMSLGTPSNIRLGVIPVVTRSGIQQKIDQKGKIRYRCCLTA
jgi:hypothetical protein